MTANVIRSAILRRVLDDLADRHTIHRHRHILRKGVRRLALDATNCAELLVNRSFVLRVDEEERVVGHLVGERLVYLVLDILPQHQNQPDAEDTNEERDQRRHRARATTPDVA